MPEGSGPNPSAGAIVVIGASAGGVETLRQVVSQLPAGLPAAVCVVLHIAPDSPSALAAILTRSGRLPCHSARDGERLAAGTILVAPPDRHLVVADGHVRLTVGPRENNHRPAVNPLFRSAAAAFGSHAVGVVLSGTLDDGTAGLAVIKSAGGATVVQDPEDALYPGMPASAIANVAVDAVVPAAEIASTIAAMVNHMDHPDDDPPVSAVNEDLGQRDTSITICPECGGVLSESEHGGTREWACRVGHRYSPDSLVNAQANDVEAALWAAIRALEDRALLLRRLSEQLDGTSQDRSARRFRRRADDALTQARTVRQALAQAATTSLRDAAAVGDEDEAESRREDVA